MRVRIGQSAGRKMSLELNDLSRHAVILGTTGSGKTVMGKVLMEEALLHSIPVVAIDPKGDIGGLGVHNRHFDFRPFTGTGRVRAAQVARKYMELIEPVEMKHGTRIFTPKSNKGVAVSLLPDLSAPRNFRKLTENDPNIVADFVEPVSQSILQLADVKNEKAQSLISQILIDNWSRQNDLSIEGLIRQIVEPGFSQIGSLDLEDFMKEKERAKLASQVNVILSSPAKLAWQHGEALNVDAMLKNHNLSVFDLRYTTNDEKQYVVLQVLQEIYKFLLRKGGSQRLRYMLYIDELAGLLPPAPANPPCKKVLELLIRQARAFGLGIIIATQNPGDVDYRIFGNIGTRFIGRLRTQKDIEKVAVAMDLRPSRLKTDVAKLREGDFVYTNTIRNTMKTMHSRWLYTYHGGPLKPKEIAWINNPPACPYPKEPLTVHVREKKPEPVPARVVVDKVPKTLPKKTQSSLKYAIQQVKKHADKTQVKIRLGRAKEYNPHLRIVVEPGKVRGAKLELQGPYTFDLCSRMIPLGPYFRNVSWSSFIPDDIVVNRPRYSIRRVFEYTVSDARQNLKTTLYRSTFLSAQSTDIDEIYQKNYKYIMANARFREANYRDRMAREAAEIDKAIKQARQKIRQYTNTVSKTRAKRMIKRVFAGRKLSAEPADVRQRKKRIEQLKRELARLQKKRDSVMEKYQGKILSLNEKAVEKARTHVKKFVYIPTRKDMVVHATILLLPKRKSEA